MVWRPDTMSSALMRVLKGSPMTSCFSKLKELATGVSVPFGWCLAASLITFYYNVREGVVENGQNTWGGVYVLQSVGVVPVI